MSSSESNIWSSFLKESSKRAQNQEATCIVLGNDSSGKKALTKAICPNAAEWDISASRNDIVSYSFFDADDKDLEAPTRVNMWLFGSKIFDHAFDIVHQSGADRAMVFVIVLDLSQPDTCVPTLVDWLQRVNAYTKQYHDSTAPAQSAASKQALLQYVKTARIKKGKAAKDAEEAEPALEALSSEDLFIQDNFALPILVVGNKADTVVADTSAAMKQARELQGRIRSICLEVGAALVYTSSTTAASTGAGNNTAVLKSYVMHRLYPDQISMELSLEDKLETCFVPAGFDTAELIRISSGVKHSPGEYQRTFKADLMRKQAQAKSSATESAGGDAEDATASGEFKGELESEQTWLQGLHEFIAQVSASGAPSTSSSAVHSRNPSDTTVATAAATAAGAEAHTEGAGAGIAAEELEGARTRGGARPVNPAVPGTRRASTRINGAPSEKKEVGDFFKNLLKK